MLYNKVSQTSSARSNTDYKHSVTTPTCSVNLLLGGVSTGGRLEGGREGREREGGRGERGTEGRGGGE